MKAWVDTLRRFSANIRTGTSFTAEEMDCSNYEIARGIDVYRNNYRGNLHDSLAGAYPVIGQLVGAIFFRSLAARFIERHASRSGNLHHYGSEMADFLAHFEPVSHLIYLPDVARAEWAYHLAYFSDDVPAFDLNRLAAVAEESYPELRWHLHPSCSLLASVYPIARIWQMHQDGAPDDMEIDLESGGDRMLIYRNGLQSQIIRITAAEYHCLQLIEKGEALGLAFESTLPAYPEFDLVNSLRHWLEQSILTDFELSNS